LNIERFIKEDFVFDEQKQKIIACPEGQKAVSSQYRPDSRKYYIQFRADICKACHKINQCNGKFNRDLYKVFVKNSITVPNQLSRGTDNNRDTKGGNSLPSEKQLIKTSIMKRDPQYFKSNRELNINMLVQIGWAFCGEVKFGDTIETVHKINKTTRESILCFLYNLAFNIDLKMSIEDINNTILIYLHNIGVVLEGNFGTNKEKINNSELKVLDKMQEEVCYLQERMNRETSVKTKLEIFFEIRKWVTMGYTVIKTMQLSPDVKDLLICAYVDEDFKVTVVSMLTDDFWDGKGLEFEWRDILEDEIPELLDEMKSQSMELRKQKYDEESVYYLGEYMRAYELLGEGKFDQAKPIFEKIIQTDKIFEFTSGAYVNLATILLNTELTNNPGKGRIQTESFLYKALEIKPENSIVAASFVQLYVLLNDYEEALIWLKRCKTENSQDVVKQFLDMHLKYLPEFLFADDITLRQIANSKEVLAFFEEALKMFPGEVYLKCTIARFYLQKEDVDLLRIYDIYKDIISKHRDLYVGYLYISELCGPGYLDRPTEQEQYALKAIKLIDDLLNGYKGDQKILSKLQESRFMAEGLVTVSWLGQKKYEDVLKITERRVKETPNNTDIHNRAAALFYLGLYNESIAYCQRELFVEEDEATYMLLGKNFYKRTDYEDAVKCLRKALSFINNSMQRVTFIDESGHRLTSITKQIWQEKKLMEIYILLIDSYYRLEDYINAKAIWIIAQERFPEDSAINVWGNVINTILVAKNQSDFANQQYQRIVVELEEERQKTLQSTSFVRKWALDLMKIQGIENNNEINDTHWELFARKVDDIINKMRTEVKDSHRYSALLDQFKSRFVKLDDRSIEFLGTAEFLYEFNKNNSIDFAPIMVEYCKVIELELRIILKNNNAMFGESLRYIEKFQIKPLILKYTNLKEIYIYRNGSAHTGLSTKKKVERVRQLLLEDGVLDVICDMK